ncbi:hypothetical protein QBZ16_003461 [Prototheca wickerhamii]|uniref:HTH La-type RNA-binding domain-containing protein n=1 Tax=Prototheca wickerhamii TaxID=3111 RepID=A0AAD9IHJ4_PROWI|nr:hypothetical protein QBZ16_003461 [Prototheca wickerhamii]
MAAAATTYSLTEDQKEKLLKQVKLRCERGIGAQLKVEFYFSDSNLPRDAFMLEKVRSSPEGFVPLALLATFQRMSKLLNSSHRDVATVPAELVEALAATLEASASLTLSEDRASVRRTEALPEFEELSKQVEERSLYVSPFPFDTTLDQLTEFFAKVGDVRSVRMRRHLSSKDFRGSVFVELSSTEEAQRKRPREEEKEAAAPAEVEDYVPGCCVAFDFGEDCEFAEVPTFGLVKDSFGGKMAGLKYADYNQGDKNGVVRFATPEEAKAIVEGADEAGTIMVAGYKAAIKVLEGEEEKEYMAKTGGVGMAGSDGPPAFDIVTQLQQNLGQVTLLLYNFIGTTQRDAGPASIKGEGIIAPSSSPSLPIEQMADQLRNALRGLKESIDALPGEFSREEEQFEQIVELQQQNVKASEQLGSALGQAKAVLAEAQQAHAALADASLGIKLPVLVLVLKNLHQYFTFEVQVLDDTGIKRRFRASNYQE